MPPSAPAPSKKYLRLVGSFIFAAARLEALVLTEMNRLTPRLPVEIHGGPDGWRSTMQLSMSLRRDSGRIVGDKKLTEFIRRAADALKEADEIRHDMIHGRPTDDSRAVHLVRTKNDGTVTPISERWLTARILRIDQLITELDGLRAKL